MSNKIILTIAPTGNVPTREMNPNVPLTPTRIPAPAAAAVSASAAVVTVTTTALPASCKARSPRRRGSRKKLVTAGGSASRAAILPSKPSSSQLASPRAGPSESRYLASLPASGYGVPGTRR